METSQRAVIFANGDVPDPSRLGELIRPDDFLVAADGGMRHLDSLGLQPQLLIGDLDSLSAEQLGRLTAAKVHIIRHPTHKDETDLELAMQWVVQAGYPQVVVVGALGGRLDQTLGNLSLLRAAYLTRCQVRCDDGIQEVFRILGAAEISGNRGDTVSLIPLEGNAEGVRTEGLEYPLQDETLFVDQTRGISNVMISSQARVVLKSGAIYCVHSRKQPREP